MVPRIFHSTENYCRWFNAIKYLWIWGAFFNLHAVVSFSFTSNSKYIQTHFFLWYGPTFDNSDCLDTKIVVPWHQSSCSYALSSCFSDLNFRPFMMRDLTVISPVLKRRLILPKLSYYLTMMNLSLTFHLLYRNIPVQLWQAWHYSVLCSILCWARRKLV